MPTLQSHASTLLFPTGLLAQPASPLQPILSLWVPSNASSMEVYVPRSVSSRLGAPQGTAEASGGEEARPSQPSTEDAVNIIFKGQFQGIISTSYSPLGGSHATLWATAGK